MKSFWSIECINGALKLVETVVYSNKVVKRVYNNPSDRTSFEIVG
jgi:hypothetical protein